MTNKLKEIKECKGCGRKITPDENGFYKCICGWSYMIDPAKKFSNILTDVLQELLKTEKKMGKRAVINSTHEGYAVILEELDELWVTIKNNQPSSMQRPEAIQVAAMAVRYICDLCSTTEEK